MYSHALSPHLTSLFRWSIDHYTVYGSWKLARVSSIFKKDDLTDPGNYRPVSLLFVPSKLLESEINNAIVNHVTSNTQFNYSQSVGLQKKKTKQSRCSSCKFCYRPSQQGDQPQFSVGQEQFASSVQWLFSLNIIF